jgi:3',5'-cyclic AMP phosphodiesterase CpdA
LSFQFRFAIASDLHIALPQTIWDHPSRFHLVEYSIAALENILSQFEQLNLDFLLLPGDLTQHGEAANHTWLSQRLARLPYPVYVIPGNHDVPSPESVVKFAPYYTHCGYDNPDQLFYSHEILPGVRLIGLNSNLFNADGSQTGALDPEQMAWLDAELAGRQAKNGTKNGAELTLVTLHHNIVEHMPAQASNSLGKRYMLDNAEPLCELLHRYGVQLVFTGHLHVQDIAYSDRYNLYDITTGSTVSYPHPYRVLDYLRDKQGNASLQITSHRIKSLPGQPDFLHFSREWMGDRSAPFISRLLTDPPLSLSPELAATLVPQLRYFWADLADGDAAFSFPDFPTPARQFLEAFSDRPPADNHVCLKLS